MLNNPAVVPVADAYGMFKVCTVPVDVKDGAVLVAEVLVANVWLDVVMPFSVVTPLLPHVALPFASLTKAEPSASVPPVTIKFVKLAEVAVNVPLSIAPAAFIVPLVKILVISLFPNCIVLLVKTDAPLPNAVELDSPSPKYTWLPIPVLKLPVFSIPALNPINTDPSPIRLLILLLVPNAIFFDPVVLEISAEYPIAVLSFPVVLN